MKVKKIFIVIPVVIATIYIVSLGTGDALFSKQVEEQVRRLFGSSSHGSF